MRILIAGAGGQLGQDLLQALSDHELYPADHQTLDITDPPAVQKIVEAARPACIINAAAYNDVDGAESNAAVAFAVNGDGPGHLAAAAGRAGAMMVHVSTDYVFDGRKGSAYDEHDSPNPLSVYASSKLEGERRVLDSGPSVCVLRTAWLYGRHGRNFVKAIQAAAERGEPLKVVADQVGSPTATADLAAAIAELIGSPARGLFHVVNGGACSRFEFARAIVGDRVDVIPIDTAEAARPARRPANSSLTSVRWPAAALRPLRDWRQALRHYLSGG